MVVEMHLSGVHEAIFLRDRDADAFISNYKEWIRDSDQVQIFEFFHNGSIHCFSLSAVTYLKVKMPTEVQTQDLAMSGPLLAAAGASARH